MKKTLSYIASLVVSTASLLVLAPAVAHAAAPYTCTWTGAGANSNFSTAGNWSGCNSAAPVAGDGDNLVFDSTSLAANKTLNNDITGLTLGSITFQGSNSGSFTFTLTGNAVTIASGVTSSSSNIPVIDFGLTLSANQTFTGSSVNYGDQNTVPTLNLNGHTLTLGTGTDTPFVSMGDALTGSGNVTVSTGANAIFNAASTWTGNVSVASGAFAYDYNATGLGAASNTVTVANTGELTFCSLNGGTVPENITIGGTGANSNSAALNSFVNCFGGGGNASTAPAKVTLSGTITLTSNTTVNSADAMTITGPLSGKFTITPIVGMSGSLVINSSNNTSLTPNGTNQAATTTINYPNNSPTTAIDVPKNVTAVVDGTYGTTTVENGCILKGIGTIGDLTVFKGGIVAPGHSPGCITVSGNLQMGGTYQAEIGGTTACSGYDQLIVTGTVTLDDGLSPATQATLQLSLVNGFKPTAGQTFEIINNQGSGAVSDTFSSLPEGSTITVSGYVFKITYKGGTGNDVVLTVVSVPATPNTGFAFIKSQPLTVLAGTVLVGGSFFYGARRKMARSRR